MANILENIANEHDDAYCISPETIEEAINRGVTKAEVCIALVGCMAGNTGELYLEDAKLCAWTALHQDYYNAYKNLVF